MIRRIEFDQQLDELRSLLQDMGKHMEEALANSVSLQTLDAEKAQAVIKNDVQLNNMEEQIMDIGSRLIVTQHLWQEICAGFWLLSGLQAIWSVWVTWRGMSLK